MAVIGRITPKKVRRPVDQAGPDQLLVDLSNVVKVTAQPNERPLLIDPAFLASMGEWT